jgi:FkbM family methyltransferase
LSAKHASDSGATPLAALSGGYALARRLGLLERRWFRRLYVRAYAAYKSHYEDPYEALLRGRPQLVRGGSVADVGAHIGYTAGVFCRAIDPGYRVYAFEPDPSNAGLLREDLEREIAAGRVVVIEAAVGADQGSAELLRSAVHPGDHRVRTAANRPTDVRQAVTVPLVSLDGFFEARVEERLAFVKVDVQGYELDVCRGMERTLERFPAAAVALEYSPVEARAMGFEPERVLAFFRDRSYRLYQLGRGGRAEPLAAQELEQTVARRGYADLLCVK